MDILHKDVLNVINALKNMNSVLQSRNLENAIFYLEYMDASINFEREKNKNVVEDLKIFKAAIEQICTESSFVELSHEKIEEQRNWCFKIAQKAKEEYYKRKEEQNES